MNTVSNLFRNLSMVKVTVKWGKERYELDACTDDSPLQLKSQLFSLTGVNPDRQKVLVKVIIFSVLLFLISCCLFYELLNSILHNNDISSCGLLKQQISNESDSYLLAQLFPSFWRNSKIANFLWAMDFSDSECEYFMFVL